MDTIEVTILQNLLHNEDYSRKVIPFIEPDYFQEQGQKLVFEEVVQFISKYDTQITVEEESENWMKKFEKIEDLGSPNINSPTKNITEFRREFLEKSGDHSREISSGPESEVIDKAVETLDESQAEDAFADAIELADTLQDSDLIHPDNMVLHLDDFDEKLDSLRRGLGDDEDL